MSYPVNLLQQFETATADEALKDELMSIEQLHGFLCAVTSNPFAIPNETWLPAIFTNSPALSKHSSTEVISNIAILLQSIIQTQLLEGKTVYPLFFEHGKEIDLSEATVEQLSSWSAGYMAGVNLHQDAWFKSGHNDIYRLLTPISAFAQFFGDIQPQYADGQPIAPEKIRETYLKLLPEAITHIFQFWRQHQGCCHHNIKTFRHEKPKVGRNMLCSCGSGKKFKKCCG